MPWCVCVCVQISLLQQNLQSGEQNLMALAALRAEDAKKFELKFGMVNDELRRANDSARERERYYEDSMARQSKEAMDARRIAEVSGRRPAFRSIGFSLCSVLALAHF